MQRPPAPLCPPLAADTQIIGTLQELQYGSQTDKERGPSNSQTNQVQTPTEMAGLVVTTEKRSVTWEYNPETGTNMEHGGKEHAGKNILLPKSQIRFTAPSPSVPQPVVGFKVQDPKEPLELSVRDPLSPPPPLPASGTCGIKQTDLSNRQSNLTGEIQKANCLEPVEIFERATELADGSHKDGQPPSAETLETGEAREQPPKDGDVQTSCDQPKGVQLESIVMEEQPTSSSHNFTVLPECPYSQDSSSKPSSVAPAVETEKFLPVDGVLETTTTTDLVHSAGAQEIVVVREDSHIPEDWTNMHLNQSFLLQREDGSVCEAAIINELSAGLTAGQPKLYEDGMQAAIELDSQRVEVYEFCTLVEEVAEETVCASSSSSALAPHSPGYEVNLFNALLEHSEEYTIKEDLEPSDGAAVIISQQPVTASNSNSTNLFVQTSRTASVGQRLVLEDERAVAVAKSGEVRLVEVTADALAVQQADAGPQIVTTQEVSDSPAVQTVSPKQKAGAMTFISPVVVAGQTVPGAVVREASDSPLDGTTAAGASPETPSRCIKSIPVPAETKPEALATTRSSGFINPKLLLLKPGQMSVLKHPSSLLAPMSSEQNPAGEMANAHSSWSGTPPNEHCLPQTQCSVDKTSSPATSCDTLHPGQTPSYSPKTSQNKSDNEALTATQTWCTADTVAPGSAPIPNILCMLPASVGSEVAAGYAYEEEESEDMEQEPEAQEIYSGQISSPEEGSDEEPDVDKTESEMTPSSPSKVSQWIADRITENASPASPSPFPSYPGPSHSSDWSSQRRDKSSPLRGPHGKFVSPTSVGGYSSSSSSPPDQAATPQRPRGERHTGMAELAKHEADIEHRTQSLKREGFWSTKRLTRLTEPPRPKVHWDYLCEEMQWLSADFAQERRWKRGVARKVVRMVMRHHEDLRQKEEKAKRDEHSKIRRVASSIAKEVRAFWSSVEKVVQYKQQSRLEEKRKKALDLQLDFIVGQTEKYSDLLSQSLAPSQPAEAEPEHVSPTPQKSAPSAADEDDRDFEPPREEEDDDEETIEVEEQQEGNDAESHRREIELLKEEGLLPLDQLLSTLKLPQETGSDEECSDVTSSSVEEDGEFTANEEDAQDEEDTIAAQEKVEGQVDHAEELDDLAKEGDMSVEELLEKYKGAYASDFEAPSASGSKDSSDSEVSGDEEEETDEDESDAESNSSSSDSQGDSRAEDDSEEEQEEEESGEEEDDNDDNEEDDCCGDEGMEVLLKEGDNSPPSNSRPKKEISHIAATAESLQPKGYTLATTKVKTPIPFLLHGTLREYQHIGLDWLVTMYEKKLNGILADEMGLGKTIQTIALLAHLACEKSNWGPHLIIVPTSVMLNWEMELKRWCPGFKILTYFGSQKERKLKRQGWTKPNAFHVCITSYKLVLQDHQAFRRKSWRYLILDEAQNIKNFKSQRWQSLLNFNSHRRLLLTGTPLQNSLMELWSLMHFLMPHVFQSHREFKEWFSNPLTGMIEGSQEYNEGLVKRLHKVLRPFLLRRIKIDVEKQMPKKYEHVVRCRLSKRQRFLYDDFMAQASTRETLASGHFMSVINILMQLRKVCNHPNLFDPRPIQSPFITKPIVFHTASLVQDALEVSPMKRCDLSMFDLVGLESRVSRYQADVFLPRHKVRRQLIQEILESPDPPPRPRPVRMKVNRMFQPPPKGENRPVLLMNKPTCSVPPAAQNPKPPPVPEVSSAPQPAPVVQQVVCTVTTAATPRPSMHPTAQIAVRSGGPRPVLTVRPPAASCAAGIPVHPGPNPGSVLPQRVLLSPDMQARLPSGEVVSIAQLASLAGRPVSSCQGSKPVTFQLQGNKLTLSGAQIHQVPAASPRPVQGNVMHLVSTGVQHHLISQPAQVAVQSNTSSTAPPTNRLALNASTQVPPSIVSSPGVVKIVVRQTAGKDGGAVPTLAVAPSPRVAPLTSLHPHTNTAPVRTAAPLQIAQRTPGPATATAHYTIAPPGNPGPTPNQPHPPRPILKVVQPPPSSAERPAPVQVACSSSTSKSSATPREGSSQTPLTPKSRPGAGVKTVPPPRRVPRFPPRSPFHTKWLEDKHKQLRESRLDFIIRVNENRCTAKPAYGREVLDFLTFLPGPRPAPAPPRPQREWGRSGHSSALHAQWENKFNFLCQSRAVREAIHSVEDRLELLNDVVDRFTFAIPPVEAPQISMHCCHPPPSLSLKQAVFSSELSTLVTPLTRSLHRIQCYMRTQFPDLRLIQYDCGKLQTLHTLLRKLKTGGHRVLIFTQMTRMLDVLEQFLNYHGHIYLRLDGSTRVEMRQSLMERFNADRRIFCFILSTRSGGVGVNLTGADTVVFYDSDWNPTMDAQAQDRCHRIGQTRDVHIYRLISERTVEENILKKANQKRMLGDMAIEGGNFTTAFFKQQTIRELFDMSEGEKREAAVELSVTQAEEEETVNKHSTTILEQALCRAEDEEDIVAASQAKAEQVAELAEFNENIPLDDGGEQEEVEELSKAEQEIAALVEQLTPIERYAMNFLETSLEDVCKEELKQAEEQVEAARKGLDQAKEEGLKLHASSDEDNDDFLSPPASVEPSQPARRGRKPKDKDKVVSSTRTSGRLRGASPEAEPEATGEVPERLRCGSRGRGAAKDPNTAPATPPQTDLHKTSSTTKLHDSSKSPPARDQQTLKTKTLPNRSHPSPVPSPPTAPPPVGKLQCVGGTDGKTPKPCSQDKEGEAERRASDTPLETSYPDHQAKDDDYCGKDHGAASPPSTSSRSPRKRQSADGEVLRGLVEDSPSAKVLRKLPGRLVTVVEEKEPRRRRRRGSGTGGGASSEEAIAEESAAGFVDEANKDHTSPSLDGKSKAAVAKSALDQHSSPSPAVHPPPVRSYPPYSPPHLFPDMPVLRNLPVRRRLETESRMAAQLGEQQQHLGRGRGWNQSRKTDPSPGQEGASTSTQSVSLVTPLKRKRGRPPKTPPRLPPHDRTVTQSLQREEGNAPLSPKRKRGRPRKDSTTTTETVSDGRNSKNENTNTGVSDGSKTEASSEPTPTSSNKSEIPKADFVTTSHDAQFTRAEETDGKTPNPPQCPTADNASTPAAASMQAPTTPTPAAPTPASVQAPTPAAPTPASVQAPTPTAPTPASVQAPTPPTPAAPTPASVQAPTPTAPTQASVQAPTPTAPTPASVQAPTPTAPTPPTPTAPTPASVQAPTPTAPTPAAASVQAPTAPTPPTTAAASVQAPTAPTPAEPTVSAAPTPTASAAPTPAAPTASAAHTPPTPAAPTQLTPTFAAPTSPTAAAPIPPTSAAPTPLRPTAAAPLSLSSTSARCVSCAPATQSPDAALTQVSSAASMSIISATSTPNTTAPLPLASTVTSTPAGVQTTLVVSGASKAPAEPKPSVTTTAKAAAPSNTSVPPPTATSPLTEESSALPTDAVPASVLATTITASVVSKPGSAAPAVATTAKSVTTKSAPVTDLSSTTFTPTIVPSTLASPQKLSASTSTSSPTIATTTVATVRASPTAPNAGSNVAASKPTTAQVSTHRQVSSDKPCAVLPPTTAPAGVTTPKAKTVPVVTSPPVEKVQGETETPSREHTSSTVPPTEKAVNIPPPLTTTTTLSPLPTVTTTTSSPEKSPAAATPTTKASTNPAPSVSLTILAAPPLTATQTSAVTPVQSSAFSNVTPPAWTEAPLQIPTPVTCSVSSEKPSLGPLHMSPAKGDPDTRTDMAVDDVRTSKEGREEEHEDTCKSQPKRRRVDSSSQTKDFELGRESEAPSAASTQKDEAQQEVEKTTENKETPIQKRPPSRQSSRESARSSSSSSSSGCSTSTLTRHAHHKRTYENRHPAKKRRMDVTSDTGKEKSRRGGEKGEEGCDEALGRRRRSRSSSFTSSDSDNSGSGKEHRLTRSAKRGLQDQERKKGNGRQAKKSDRNVLNNANASTGGESGSDTSSVGLTKKSAVAPPSQAGKAQTNSAPSAPPEPEVLGKRCSALNAAAKLLAMKGRVDTPGHTPRRDAAAKASSSDKNQKPKNKSVPTSSQSNSVKLNRTNNKSSGSKPAMVNQARRAASRSTRQCPGSLVPPLDLEFKRSRAEEKEGGSRKLSGKEGEPPSSSRGHSACSSMSSDGEAAGGEGAGRRRSSRSRSSSSSNSSQRTHSLSSQNTEHRESRAASSGSERGRGRSESRRDRRSHRLSHEAASGSGAEGTPDRVLRSVAALAAVQARSPAASTRSSSGHHRHNKT